MSLPDPSGGAVLFSLLLLAAAVIVAVVFGPDATGFDPNEVKDAELTFFAGFILAATMIERILELVAPFFPPGAGATATPAQVAQKKANRGYILLSLATLLGVVLSVSIGLFLPEVIGMDVPKWADVFLTGVAISGGSKSFHELVKALQKAKGSGTTAG